MKRVAVISYDERAGVFHAEQMEFLFDNRIKAFSMDVPSIRKHGLEKQTYTALPRMPLKTFLIFIPRWKAAFPLSCSVSHFPMIYYSASA